MDFTVRIYKVSQEFPIDERYGLITQLRRSAVSISSNISEGAGRSSAKDFRRFLEISMGSLNEAQNQIEIAFRLNFIVNSVYEDLITEALEIYKMVLGLHRSLGSKIN